MQPVWTYAARLGIRSAAKQEPSTAFRSMKKAKQFVHQISETSVLNIDYINVK